MKKIFQYKLTEYNFHLYTNDTSISFIYNLVKKITTDILMIYRNEFCYLIWTFSIILLYLLITILWYK